MVIRANITNASTVLKNETASWDLQGSSFEIAKEDLIHPYNITVSGVPKMLNLIGTPPTPDNLTLFVTPQSVAPGETVSATATLTNRTTGTKFSGWDVEIRITGDGTETLPAKTCTAVSYTLHAAGSYTFTANNSSLSLDNSPITIIVTQPSRPYLRLPPAAAVTATAQPPPEPSAEPDGQPLAPQPASPAYPSPPEPPEPSSWAATPQASPRSRTATPSTTSPAPPLKDRTDRVQRPRSSPHRPRPHGQ